MLLAEIVFEGLFRPGTTQGVFEVVGDCPSGQVDLPTTGGEQRHCVVRMVGVLGDVGICQAIRINIELGFEREPPIGSIVILVAFDVLKGGSAVLPVKSVDGFPYLGNNVPIRVKGGVGEGSGEVLGFQSLVEHAVIVTEEEKLPGFFNLVVVSELD